MANMKMDSSGYTVEVLNYHTAGEYNFTPVKGVWYALQSDQGNIIMYLSGTVVGFSIEENKYGSITVSPITGSAVSASRTDKTVFMRYV